jgi:hypothetical protein
VLTRENLEAARPRRRLVGLLVVLVLVIGILMGLQAWSDSISGPWGAVSVWQFRLIGAIELGAILILFWTALRAGRSLDWIFPVLLAAGAGFHVYRIVVFSGVLPGGDAYTVARARFPDAVWLPLHLLLYVFAMGIWGVLDRTRAKRALERIARFNLPITGLAVFLLIHYALHAYTRWAGPIGFHFNVLWPSALGVSVVLRPVLLIGAFYVLNATRGVLRKRPFEWALAGLLVGLLLTTPPHVLGSSLGEWAADAAASVSVIGLAAWLLPGSRRYERITLTDKHLN